MGIYTVMAVSYLSYYELFLSEFTGDVAFARRIRIVQLPPIDPDVLYEKLKPHNMSEKSNTFWWFTRGRLGWVASLKDVVLVDDASVGALLEWVKSPQLKTPIAENLPILDVDELLRFEDTHCGGDDRCRAALRFFILNIRPLRVEELPNFVRDNLSRLAAALVQCDNLVHIDHVVNAFARDIEEFCNRAGIILESEDLELIRRALNEIFSALALRTDKEKMLCISAPNAFKLNDITREYVDSIIDILMTYIAENYGTNERVRNVTEALYLVYSLALSKEKWDEHGTFHEVKELFQRHIGHDYVVIGPWMLRRFIPMYLSNPIISKEPGMSIERLEQDLSSFLASYDYQDIADAIASISEYITRQKGAVTAYIIPLPRPQYMAQQLQESIYNIIRELMQRHMHDMKYGSARLMLFFAGGTSSFVQQIKDKLKREEALLDLLIDKTKRVALEPVPGERLSDFVKSLFVLFMNERQRSYEVTVEGIVSTLKPDQRRRVEYFKTTLSTWINDAVEKYEKGRESSLRIDELHRLYDDIVNDLNVLRYVINRTQKFRPHMKAYAGFFTLINMRAPFEKMQLSLAPGGLVKVKTLPSIYQEFHLSHRGGKCVSVIKLLDIPIVSDIVRIALEDRKEMPLVDALKILEDEDLPLFNDFVEVLEKTLGIRYSDWSNELRLLYRLILLSMLLSIRKDDIITMFTDKSDKVKDAGNRLKELLDEIEAISNSMCRELPLCIRIAIRPERRTHSLGDEIRGILSAIDMVEYWIKELQSGKDIGYDQFLSLAYVTVFGLPEESELLLDQIHEEFREWYDKLHEKVYSQLTYLQQKLRQLPIKVRESRRVIELSIESLKAVDNTGNRLSEILKEVDEIARDYSEAVREFEEVKQGLRTIFGGILEKLSKLELIGGA